IAGLASPLLFWRVCRRWLPPLEAFLSISILAVAYFPVRHSCEAKPYAGDLFVALALQAIALAWLRRPQQLRWLVLLCLITPVALTASYPAIFIAGAISPVLFLPALRQPGWKTRALFVLFNAIMTAA